MSTEKDSCSELKCAEEKLKSLLDMMNRLVDRESEGLFRFARSGSLHDLLLANRHLLASTDKNGNTPIHVSVLSCNMESLKAFVDVSLTIASENILEKANNQGMTALLLSAYGKESYMFRYLLEKGADINKKDSLGCNVFHAACSTGNIEIIRLILEGGVPREVKARLLSSLNAEGMTGFHICCRYFSASIVRELLSSGFIDINEKSTEGYSGLHYACMRSKQYRVVEELIEKGIDVKAESPNGVSALHISICNKNYLTIMRLRYASTDRVCPLELKPEWKDMSKWRILQECVKEKLAEEGEFVLHKAVREIKSLYDRTKGSGGASVVDAHACCDMWIEEIFKGNLSISRKFFKELLCFEEVKDELICEQAQEAIGGEVSVNAVV